VRLSAAVQIHRTASHERSPLRGGGAIAAREHREGSGFYPSSSFGFPARAHLSSGGVMRVVTSTMMTTAE